MTTKSHLQAQTSISKRVSPETVQQAVGSLLKWRDSKSQNEKPKLFDQDDNFIYLILTLKDIPQKGRVNAHKILLPHSLCSKFSEICLIIDDRPKSKLTKEDVWKKIKAENIPVSKVLKLSKLKSNHRPFEAKRKLCDSYNMFFADKSVIPLLPRLLGKHFFKKKKIPVPMDLKHKNWKEQIEKACSSALLFLRTGTCSVVRVAKLSMNDEEIVENVCVAMNGIVSVLPKNWDSVRSFHLKLAESLALPIYQVVPELKLAIEAGKEDATKEISGNEAKEVGKLGKKKGRIHEVVYMDYNLDKVDEDEMGGDDETGEDGETEGEVPGKLLGKRRKKGDKRMEGAVDEDESGRGGDGDTENGADAENRGKVRGKLLNKKRKKGDTGKARALHVDELGSGDDGDGEEEEDGENGGEDSCKLSDKKRKKGDKSKEEARCKLNGARQLKKSPNAETKEFGKQKIAVLSDKEQKKSVKQKSELTQKVGESGEKKGKKKSGILKSKGVEMKVKSKKSKKAIE